MSSRAAAVLMATGAWTLLLSGCLDGGATEAGGPITVTYSSPASPAETSPASTEAEPAPVATAPPSDSGASETVRGVGDVPTTPEKIGTDVLPKSAPPWHEELSDCDATTVRFVFNRDIPAIVVFRGQDVLAWAGLYRRDVSDTCEHAKRKGLWSEDVRSTTELRTLELVCRSPGRIRIDAHPVERHSSVYGSSVVVGVAGTVDWMVAASVVEDLEGRRVHVNHAYCTPSS